MVGDYELGWCVWVGLRFYDLLVGCEIIFFIELRKLYVICVGKIYLLWL